ncbi:MAG: hypothetical protein KKG33_06535 [candidate division Zixibacteria bacterium]|nr:hypothetical protein [candidate division Zixibacteria bacterium]MBU1470520.1 hypothetical protein [candidate division Zixibacteria bacterium]MBU2625200.1 hypothetical protein [candidate division Zixibacteria bacterium]
MPTQTKEGFGGYAIARYNPDKEKLSQSPKIFNVVVSFEEALKLNLALDECLRQVNKYDRRTSGGKKKGISLLIHLEKDRIRIVEHLT